LKMIIQTLQQIMVKIASLTTSFTELTSSVAGLVPRVQEVEQCIQAAEDNAQELGKQVHILEHEMNALKACLDDQENRSHKNNLHIVGFPEGVEQGKPIRFLPEQLPKLLNLLGDTLLEIERAHRVLGPPPTPGHHPRAFIIKLLHFPTKEKILHQAREIGPLEWQGQHIVIFLDLSRELQEKKKLRDKGLKYGLFYPATLQIMVNGSMQAFTTVEEAERMATRSNYTPTGTDHDL
uniref:L1 transposable element RRM domain-containing protein n=1 Tax=Latimeria chalumnae TaxID=7897 RepID=H3AGG7_LATCH